MLHLDQFVELDRLVELVVSEGLGRLLEGRLSDAVDHLSVLGRKLILNLLAKLLLVFLVLGDLEKLVSFEKFA